MPGYFSMREFPAYQAQIEFLKERGVTYEDVMHGSIEMATAVLKWNPESLKLNVVIVAPHFWMMLNEGYGR